MKQLIKKTLVISAITFGLSANQVHAVSGLGVGAGYGLFSGPTVELNYAINPMFQVRGSLSTGMNFSETASVNDVKFKVTNKEGGINRLALNFHPFEGHFFLSAGYAFNAYKLEANGNASGSVKVGDTNFTGVNVNMKGDLEWNNAPSLSLGWGHSPTKGWGAMIEMGAVFTGAAKTNLNATGSYNNGAIDVSNDPAFQSALREEERKLRKEVAKVDFMPILQAQVTYRF